MNSLTVPFIYDDESLTTTTFPDNPLLCTICTEPLLDPQRTHPCRHHFCSACILRWMESSKTCPMDRNPIYETLMEADGDVVRRLDALWIVCECGYKGPRVGHLGGGGKGVSGCLEEHTPLCRASLDIQEWFPNLRFGMTPTEVARFMYCNKDFRLYFHDLPIATEVTNFECRYFWHSFPFANHLLTRELVNILPTVYNLMSPYLMQHLTRPYYAYICLQFHESHGLCMISIRTIDPDFVRRVGKVYGITVKDGDMVSNKDGMDTVVTGNTTESAGVGVVVPRRKRAMAKDLSRGGCFVWMGADEVPWFSVEFVDPRLVPANGKDYL
ncbi:hypothetical protein HDU76_002496 [Blyttiomyces sp. JEL0837]|nr:hypothetical protein HDU76_002496 [Blyttiomyces sp. JEL0837]